MPAQDLLAKKQQSMKAVESWDADFEVDEDFDPAVFQSSVSSAGSFADEGLNRGLQGLSLDALEENDGVSRMRTISRKASRRILSRASEAELTGTVRRLNRKTHEDESGDFDESTLRVGSPKKREPASVMEETFFDPPTSPQKSRPIPIKESFEDGFELDDDEADLQRRLQRKKAEPHPDELESWDDESLGVRASSRLSEASSSLCSSSMASETDDDDFLDGLQVPEQTDRFQEILEERQREAQRVAEQEEELLLQGKKYETIRSTGSGNSLKSQLDLMEFQDNDDELENDFLDGIELTEENLTPAKDHLHRNVKVNNKHTLKSKPSVQFAPTSPRKASTPSLQPKKSMPILQPDLNLPKKPRSPSKPEPNHSSGLGLQGASPLHPRGSARLVGEAETSRSEPRGSGGVPPENHSSGLGLQGGVPPENHSSGLGRGSARLQRTGSNLGEAESAGGRSQQRQQQTMKHRMASSSLRPVQSMVAIGSGGKSPKRNSSEARLKYAKPRNRGFADGTELDLLEELPTDATQEKSFTVTPRGKGTGTVKRRPLDTYKEKSSGRPSTVTAHTKSSVLKDKSAQVRRQRDEQQRRPRTPKKSAQKGPGLIQQLGPPVASIVARGHNGDMHFNPRKLIWEGNDVELKKFESVNPKGPGLIAFISNKGVQVVGDMVFDPQKMCWINVKEEQNGTPAEEDPFKDVEDLDVSMATSQGTTHPQSALSSVHGGDFAVGDEFDVPSDIIKRMQHEDDRWQRKTKGWFAPDESYDRKHLHEIRLMVMKRS
ncbi:hypothetical protein TRICI_004359 [Trichomonascus ciferrii]|uniref:Uncharacterized protein n=1 Tax=Trichomonascus ciferrii TaxID=44093 RepID=A0A642V0E5_9ASCO|nr:hypothetical protein TRICI_004359 [Trichomonascus ciferrii]